MIDPNEMAKRARGSFDFCLEQGERILLGTGNDNTIVSLGSTFNPVIPVPKATRWIARKKQKKQVDQPFTVSQYNRYMDGVDRMDQNIDNYRMSVRSKKKWWWLVFAFAVDASLHNARQLYRKADNNCPLDYLAFTRRIVQFYLHKYGTPNAMPSRPAATKPHY